MRKQGLTSLHLTMSITSPEHHLTKRMLASNIARVYDILWWYSPTEATCRELPLGDSLREDSPKTSL